MQRQRQEIFFLEFILSRFHWLQLTAVKDMSNTGKVSGEHNLPKGHHCLLLVLELPPIGQIITNESL